MAEKSMGKMNWSVSGRLGFCEINIVWWEMKLMILKKELEEERKEKVI